MLTSSVRRPQTKTTTQCFCTVVNNWTSYHFDNICMGLSLYDSCFSALKPIHCCYNQDCDMGTNIYDTNMKEWRNGNTQLQLPNNSDIHRQTKSYSSNSYIENFFLYSSIVVIKERNTYRWHCLFERSLCDSSTI